MAPLPSIDTSFPYVTVPPPSHNEEFQKLSHLRSKDDQVLPDELVEYNTLDRCSLPGRNIKHRTRNNNGGNPDYSTLPGQVSRCNNNAELVFNTNTHNADNSSGYSSLPVTMKSQFTQCCYSNRHSKSFCRF